MLDVTYAEGLFVSLTLHDNAALKRSGKGGRKEKIRSKQASSRWSRWPMCNEVAVILRHGLPGKFRWIGDSLTGDDDYLRTRKLRQIEPCIPPRD